jgi:putative peptidoglycan lipid II flippase
VSSLLSSTRAMAVGTAASRVTGFLRTAVIAGVLGVAGVADAFNVANTAPNIVYELLLGGLLSSVVVPLLVRAQKSGEGEAYAQRLLSLTVVALGLASVLLVLLAPAVVAAYSSSSTSEDTKDLAVVFARFFLPQVLFYGAGAIMGAYLNTRGRFGPPMWAPVLNNVIVILTGGVFLLLPGPDELEPGSITDTQVAVLGIGVTLGIVAQTVALVPALRAVGFRFRFRLDLRGTGLRHAASLAKWVGLYVLANQAAYFVVVKLATGAPPGRGYSTYVYAFVLWQLPHAVVAVSVITALLPRMSRFAADGRIPEMRATLSQGLRLTLAVLVPAAVTYFVLGRSIATLVFAHGNVSVEEARYIGTLLGVFSVGLVAFSCYQLMLRAFYAMQDTRTPTMVNLWVNATLVVVDVALVLVLPDRWEVTGLAAGQAASFLVGLVVVTRVLVRRTHSRGGATIIRTAVRCTFAVVPAAVLAFVVSLLVEQVAGTGPWGAVLTLVVAGPVLLVTYVVVVRRLHVPEVDQVLAPVLARLPG